MEDKKELPKVIKMRERMLAIQVCASIPPDRAEKELEDAVAEAGYYPGTINNRWCYDPERDKELNQEAVPCAEHEGRWHYVLYC